MPKPYDSEFMLFMREWLEKHSGEREVQRTGHAILWDRPEETDPELCRGFDAAHVPVKPYYYDISR
jgi:hypothetical protein